MTVEQYQISLGLESRPNAVTAKAAIEEAAKDFGVNITPELIAFAGACKPTREQRIAYWRRWHDPEAVEPPKLSDAALWRVRVWIAKGGIDTSIPGYAVRLAWLTEIEPEL